MGRPRRRNNKSQKREIYGQIGIPIEPRDNEITIITNAISISIPSTDHVPSKIQVNIGYTSYRNDTKNSVVTYLFRLM